MDKYKVILFWVDCNEVADELAWKGSTMNIGKTDTSIAPISHLYGIQKEWMQNIVNRAMTIALGTL